MARPVRLLIVGAGPFGLALGAYARSRGVDALVVGRPAEFWRAHMPPGMLLRSGTDWHLDVTGERTLERFLRERGRDVQVRGPIARERYLEYLEWFRRDSGIPTVERYVVQLRTAPSASGRLVADLDDGTQIAAENVALALGFGYFPFLPPEVSRWFPPARIAHTCDFTDFRDAAGRRILIVGGRQSAFEWAALLREAGAARVHLVHRHPSPRFEESDWSWVTPLVERFADDPGWFRRLPLAERRAINDRMFAEGRRKIEPWLRPRIDHPSVRVWPDRRIVGARPGPGEELQVELDSGDRIEVDRVVFATGYRPDLSRVPFLAGGDLRGRVASRAGSPLLSDRLETTVPGLFVTSLLAAEEFGAFFAFTVSARASARLIVEAIAPATVRGGK